ncbi:MAG: HD domain-containing phosphohydrolase [Planctomycetota bacterium]
MEASNQSAEVMKVITDLVDEMVAALVNTSIYWSDHPRVQESISKLRTYLGELSKQTSEDSISISVSKDFLVFRQRPLLGASLIAPRLIRPIQGWGAGGVQLDVDATAKNFSTFFEVLMMPPSPGDTHGTINNLLTHRACGRIRMLPPYQAKQEAGGDEDADADADGGGGEYDRVYLPVRLYQGAVDILQNTTVVVCSGGRIQFDDIRGHTEQMVKSLQSNDGPMMSLAREEQYDAFTFGHSVRVSILALNFGTALTDDPDLLVRLGTAALLHDVGKCLIPFEILHSTQPLTEEERNEIGRHPLCGAEILLDHDEADDIAVATAFGHHRTMDYAGYPATAHQYRQSMVTRIVKICDVYEALTAARPYKRPITPTRAYRIMVGMGRHFDQQLLRKFIEVIGVFPNGQLVEMTTGELARVQQQGSELLLPRVEVITDVEGNRLTAEDRRIVALGDSDSTCNFCIQRALDEELYSGASEALAVGRQEWFANEHAKEHAGEHAAEQPNDNADKGDDWDNGGGLGLLDDPKYC